MRASPLLFGLLALGATASPHRAIQPRQSSGGQQVFSFPLANGFPNISMNSSTLMDIQRQAHGTLPNTPLPTTMANTSVGVWQLIAFNEIFEVAFFTSLLQNITSNTTGYDVGTGAARDIVVNAISAVQAQEELHALGANAILQAAGRAQIQPCQYVFPSYDFDSAIIFAATFTDLVVATLQEALSAFGAGGDLSYLGLIGSVIGQEGEQDGFYRVIGDPMRIPSAQPFLTASSGAFALSALLQSVVVPGSCPMLPPLPVLSPLMVSTPSLGNSTNMNSTVSNGTTSLRFGVTTNATTAASFNASSYYMVYINGQNMPIVQNLTNIMTSGNMTTFSAAFPEADNVLEGLTIATVTSSAGPFMNASAVAMSAVFGPALIEYFDE